MKATFEGDATVHTIDQNLQVQIIKIKSNLSNEGEDILEIFDIKNPIYKEEPMVSVFVYIHSDIQKIE